jgi:hypothetical protein
MATYPDLVKELVGQVNHCWFKLTFTQWRISLLDLAQRCFAKRKRNGVALKWR